MIKVVHDPPNFVVVDQETFGRWGRTTLIMFFDHLEVFSVLKTLFFELFSVQRIFPVILKTFRQVNLHVKAHVPNTISGPVSR